ncbi:sulfite reductase subunit A [Rhodothalassium salexigens]|uniref:4Fe-4S dicluster domain-containing protein n=1 Tax=Rhodothalassium salexigens TaxID=1086 RepID=UPI0019131A2E|nr:4Fe-4S dicluster domain-containing protein [Rhodothalassium salexigens]MBK5911120.1 sulfite reductase subunit A [Rhodothalassium salexigens]MBK5921990.1 sulfite reductase subunit A [Rhodothalassium salexigens]
MASTAPSAPRVLDRAGFDALLDRLQAGGRQLIGPVRRDGAIGLDRIADTDDLPQGWGDRQGAGHYRIDRRDDDALFGYAAGPDSFKRFLHPPGRVLWRAERRPEGLSLAAVDAAEPAPAYAFLGVRACDLAAWSILDRVLRHSAFPDPHYATIRDATLVVAVQCTAPAETCFCASMGTGPAVDAGFDLALTELVEPGAHRFLVTAGSATGTAILATLDTRPADAGDLVAAETALEAARRAMVRRLDTDGLADRLKAQPEHPHWQSVAERCLACGNCTQVCPTCFCTTVTDHSDLTGARAERVQHWDSCFTDRFAELSGGQVRETIAARYRQWLTHKLATWVDQFGVSGCVGCGRCIAWCPTGIDLTDEAAAIREPAP